MQTNDRILQTTTQERQPVTILRYGNTNTCFLRGGLLIDTDYAGLLQRFFREIKKNGIQLEEIRFVLATHYHPDHAGMIGELLQFGVKLLLMETQARHVHDYDYIIQREKRSFVPINESEALVLSFEESRSFLQTLGIAGRIISTPSHSPDSISVLLDDGCCIVGDLEPLSNIDAYDSNEKLSADWSYILQSRPVRIVYSHANEQKLGFKI